MIRCSIFFAPTGLICARVSVPYAMWYTSVWDAVLRTVMYSSFMLQVSYPYVKELPLVATSITYMYERLYVTESKLRMHLDSPLLKERRVLKSR